MEEGPATSSPSPQPLLKTSCNVGHRSNPEHPMSIPQSTSIATHLSGLSHLFTLRCPPRHCLPVPLNISLLKRSSSLRACLLRELTCKPSALRSQTRGLPQQHMQNNEVAGKAQSLALQSRSSKRGREWSTGAVAAQVRSRWSPGARTPGGTSWRRVGGGPQRPRIVSPSSLWVARLFAKAGPTASHMSFQADPKPDFIHVRWNY